MVALVLQGHLFDGSMIEGYDCVVIRGGKTLVAGDDFGLTNYPNPFNPTTMIRFTLPEAGPTSLEIFNIRGQKVVTLVDDILPAGVNSFEWNSSDQNGSPVSSGVYLYRLTFAEVTATKKMILVR